MANKLYAMEQLTEEVAKDIAAKPEEWMRFLDTASRLYKYTFDEQLLIFAQRPEATAVASMEVWNKRMYRWIRKGSKGIALIDYTSSPKNRLRYVFDISDTYKVRNLGKDPALSLLFILQIPMRQIICRERMDWTKEMAGLPEPCIRQHRKVCGSGFRMRLMN